MKWNFSLLNGPWQTLFKFIRICVYEMILLTLLSERNYVFAISPKQYILGQKATWMTPKNIARIR